MNDSDIRTHHLWFFDLDETPHVCITQDTNDSGDEFARYGKIRVSEKIRLLT